MAQVVRSNAVFNRLDSEETREDYSISQFAFQNINTAIPVKVIAVYPFMNGIGDIPMGYVDVLPLVTKLTSRNVKVPPNKLYKLPYMRLHGGIAAIICDPVVGDIGLAVFARDDTSGMQRKTYEDEDMEPVAPNSYRHFSTNDGWYIGGFLNQTPRVYIELLQDGSIVINASEGKGGEVGKVTVNAPGDVTVNTEQNAVVNASKSVTLTASENITANAGSAIKFSAGSSISLSAPSCNANIDGDFSITTSGKINLN